MGPGRWGSRGDIRLGVSVAYSDINNTAVLLEIARQKGRYVPELSFGTHFFQDLVEADIRYIPLYPDEPGSLFNERFLRGARNFLPDLVPELASLAEIVRVIDVDRETRGKVLRVLLNADLDEAVAVFSEPTASSPASERSLQVAEGPLRDDEHWRWRMRMAERIGANLDPRRFGVKALYVFGSAKNGTARPGSDLDLLVHFAGTDAQRDDLLLWMDGWSRSLTEVNYLRTGYRSEGLLDVHLVTDEDVARRSSFAVKIDAITDAAQPLALATAAVPGPSG
jgi:predicted nucleotidyltransferase